MSATIADETLLQRAQRMFACPGSFSELETLNMIGALLLAQSQQNNFGITDYDTQEFTYVGAGAADDDDVATIVFKKGGTGGTVVATLTFAYVGATNNVLSIVKS